MVKPSQSSAECEVLAKRNDDFWEAAQVFPKVIRTGSGGHDYAGRTLAALTKSSVANLKVICSHVGVTPSEEIVTSSQFAALLRSVDKNHCFVHLTEFMRGKAAAINEEYETTFGTNERRSHLADLYDRGGNSNARLHLLVKLLLLFERDDHAIQRIFYRHHWRRHATTLEFDANHILDAKVIKQVGDDAESLAQEIEGTVALLEVRFFGKISLGPKLDVLVFQQEHKPTVRADYRDPPKTLHGFSWILCGLHRDGSTVTLKGGGAKVGEAVRHWFDQKLSIELQPAGTMAFEDYDPVTVEDNLLGGYSVTSTIRIVNVRFRRSLAPDHGPLTFEAAFPGQDMRRGLQWARHEEVVRVRSLSDLHWVDVSFRHKDVRIEVELEPRGAVMLRLNDATLTEDETRRLCEAFRADFGLPLNTRINPQNLTMGSVEMHNYLLEAERREDVVPYQRKALQELVDREILLIDRRQVRICNYGFCELKDRPVQDEAIGECPKCQRELVPRSIDYLIHNDKVIWRTAGKLLANATGWKFSHRPRMFEKQRFFALSNPKRPDQSIHVCFTERVNKKAVQMLDRSMQAVLVVHTRGHAEHARLDTAGIAHVGFAYALAAEKDRETRARFKEDCRQAIYDLLRQGHARVLRAGHESRRILESVPEDYSGEKYEVEVFNLLRAVFPYCERWGGKNRPDGFGSLVYFEGGDQRNVVKHNWSYDSKFTTEPEGYALGAAEKRKMFDYVLALTRQPQLQTQGNRLNAHVIISNNVASSTMMAVADYLRQDHHLGKERPELKLVFLMETFLTQLYDQVQSQEPEFARRRNWLPKRMAWLMQQQNTDGYVLLDEAKATALAKWVLQQPEIETPPDASAIRDGLRELTRK